MASIKNFIAKFKNATDLNQPYLEFNLNWLNSFNKNLSNYTSLIVFEMRGYIENVKYLRNFIEVMFLETY
jgi:hypothetical protein